MDGHPPEPPGRAPPMGRRHLVRLMRRRGFTLPELLVTVPLALLVGTIAIGLLLSTGRQGRQLHATLAAHEQLLAARDIVSSDLRGLRPSDLVVVSDTLLELSVPEWLGIICAVETDGGGAQTLRAASITGEPGPRAADLLEGWERGGTLTAPPIAVTVWLTRDAEPVGHLPCTPLQHHVVPQWRVPWPHGSMRPTRPEPGLPLIARRQRQYRHYRSGERWWLGRRIRTPQGWEGIQPVAGPLAPPTSGGMRVTLLDGEGTVTFQPTRARAVHIRMLGVGPSGLVADSLGFVVPLHSARAPHG